MLGSTHSGERDAAGLAAHRLIVASGLTWRQILDPPPVERRMSEFCTWRQTVAQCLERHGSLRPWEVTVLRNLPKFRRLSTKQRYCLEEIADWVLKLGQA